MSNIILNKLLFRNFFFLHFSFVNKGTILSDSSLASGIVGSNFQDTRSAQLEGKITDIRLFRENITDISKRIEIITYISYVS